MSSRARITFYGGAGTVTGANFLLDTGGNKILIDCGALQREQTCDPENAKPFAYNPASIDALIITHAHQDHIGRVPKLVRDGFRGAIYSTPATKDLSALMFEDAIGIMNEEQNRSHCVPLYDHSDVEETLSLWHTHDYHTLFAIGDTSIELLDAGHILGSAMVKCMRPESAKTTEDRSDRTIIFSGDIGNSPEPLLYNVEPATGANYLVMESVYGDRVHEDRSARRDILKHAVETIVKQKGTLLIPSFSIERTQILLFELNEMLKQGEIPSLPVYLDAPLAIRVTEIYERYRNDLNPGAQAWFQNGGDPFAFHDLIKITNVAESREIHEAENPKIIIAGSGMSAGGRVRSHEIVYLPDPNAMLLFVGYQAPGSLGRRVQDGATSVHIDGAEVPIHARIASLSGYSGHADREQLLTFAEGAIDSIEKIFVVMGEPRASLFLSQRIQDFLDVEAVAPAAGEMVEIEW